MDDSAFRSNSGWTGLKVREYQAVLSLHRQSGSDPWTLTPLSIGDARPIPEAGIEVQVSELYVRIEFPDLPELG